MAVTAEPVVRALGLILSNSSVYGTAHAVTQHSAEDCYRTLQQAWLADDLRISLADDVLTVNQTPVEMKNRLARHLADHLAARAITDATLMRDMTQEQFLAFVEVLEAQPEELEQLGGFAGAVASVGLGAVVACRKRVYREITDDQEVVERERLATLERGGRSQGDGGDASAGGDGEPDAEAESASLLAWLQGEGVCEASGAAAEAVRDMSGDVPRLTAMILDAVEARAVADGAPAAPGEAAVEALQRVYAAMTDDPSFHTQKTKKQIQRTLVLLEQELTDKLNALNGPADGSLDMLKEAVEEMTDELTVDALAQEYARKRNAIETSERRLVRYVKRKGLDGIEDSELKQRLTESGLDDDGWRELLARCLPTADGTAGTPGDAARTISVTDDMAQLLTRLVSDAAPPAPDALPVSETVLKQDLEPVREAVEAVVRNALQRIENLVAEVDGPDGGAGTDREAAAPRLTRQRLFEILAELGQELCQPLAVITCAVEMIRGGGLGDVTALQTEMLNAAAESGDKLKTLIDRIIEIAGMPAEDAVNKSIQASLYR